MTMDLSWTSAPKPWTGQNSSQVLLRGLVHAHPYCLELHINRAQDYRLIVKSTVFYLDRLRQVWSLSKSSFVTFSAPLNALSPLVLQLNRRFAIKLQDLLLPEKEEMASPAARRM